jgi:hypothetical protein
VGLKKTALRGNLRDRRFNTILQQGLGKVAESLAKRLLVAEGFDVRNFSFNVSSCIAGVRYAEGMSPARREDPIFHVKARDWGKGTENASKEVDKTLYG